MVENLDSLLISRLLFFFHSSFVYRNNLCWKLINHWDWQETIKNKYINKGTESKIIFTLTKKIEYGDFSFIWPYITLRFTVKQFFVVVYRWLFVWLVYSFTKFFSALPDSVARERDDIKTITTTIQHNTIELKALQSFNVWVLNVCVFVMKWTWIYMFRLYRYKIHIDDDIANNYHTIV